MEIIFIVIAIFFSIISTIKPFKIGRVPINITTSSLISLVLLFSFQIIDLEMIKIGVLGNNQIKPWEIIVIFFTLAYISVSLDVTGFLDYLSYKVVHKSKGDGIKLFIVFYLFACFLTIFTSNDIIILTLTPIIFYLGKHSNINIIPLLFANFFGANTLSSLLYIGNKTNIIIGNALNLGFLEYTKIMWVPTIVATLLNLILIYLFFRKSISKKFKLNIDSNFSVKNWPDAIISSSLLIIMLIILVFSQKLDRPIWIITSFFVLIFIVKDLFFYFYYKIKYASLFKNKLVKSKERDLKAYNAFKYRHKFFLTLKKVPWNILPFILVFFILISGLNFYGLVDLVAVIISRFSTTLFSSIMVNGFLGFFLANIINNQPMSIFLSNVFISKNLQITDIAFQGGAYAIIIASNLGANLTLVGSLAGLMWKKILKTKGIEITYIDFLKTGIKITFIVFICSLISLYFVLM